MANTLQLYFPKLRERQQILDDILSRENLKREGHEESRNPPWDRQLK